MPDFGSIDAQLPFFGDEVDQNIVRRTVVQSIGFNSVVEPKEFLLPIANRLNFSTGQSAEHNYIFIDIPQTIGFVGVAGYDYEDDLIQYIGFTGPRVVLPITNHIGFENFVREETVVSCENNFGWIDHTGAPVFPEVDTALIRVYVAQNIIGFTETLVSAQLETINQSMGLADTVDSIGTTFDRPIGHSVIKQKVTFTVSGTKCPEKEYTPFVGSDDPVYGNVSITPPVLSTGTLTLTYPRITPTTTLILKNPQFGNTESLNWRVVNQTSRGGDTIIFGDPKWSTTEIRVMTIERICDPDFTNLLDFINESLGKEIGLLDWEGRNWKGVILAPTTKIVKDGRRGYNVTIQFQGELV